MADDSPAASDPIESWLESHCLSHHGAIREWKEEWQADRYLIAGKIFVLHGDDKTGRPIVTVKLPPDEGQALRQAYVDVKPGYHMNKMHWNSVYLDGEVPDDILREMITMSYAAVVEAFPARVRNQL